MKWNLVTNGGVHFKLDVDVDVAATRSYDDQQRVKQKIEDATGIPVLQQTLSFITHGSTIHLHIDEHGFVAVEFLEVSETPLFIRMSRDDTFAMVKEKIEEMKNTAKEWLVIKSEDGRELPDEMTRDEYDEMLPMESYLTVEYIPLPSESSTSS